MNTVKLNLNFPKELNTIFDIISKAKGECRLVGGCVRDYLINKVPVDFDIATNLIPEIIIKIFQRSDIKVFPIGVEHGTVLVVINGFNFEITTLRKDVKCFGRHAEVQFTNDWKEDASRRDFTMNAMSVTLNGELYDYFDGQEDLEQKKVKFVGNPTKRIEEDYLRILRYLRFLGLFGLKNIDDASYKASIKNIQNLEYISKERIRSELLKLLASQFAKEVLIKLTEENIFHYIGLSSITISSKLLQRINFKIDDPLVNLATLCNLSTTQNANKVAQLKNNLQLSNKEYKELNWLTSFTNQPKFTDYHHYKYWYEYGKDLYLRFLFVVNNITEINEYKKYLYEVLNGEDFVFPLKGRDLQNLNITGKAIGDAIKKAKDYWHANNNMPNKLELISYLKIVT
jgi:poly(A) polymerase